MPETLKQLGRFDGKHVRGLNRHEVDALRDQRARHQHGRDSPGACKRHPRAQAAGLAGVDEQLGRRRLARGEDRRQRVAAR